MGQEKTSRDLNYLKLYVFGTCFVAEFLKGTLLDFPKKCCFVRIKKFGSSMTMKGKC